MSRNDKVIYISSKCNFILMIIFLAKKDFVDSVTRYLCFYIVSSCLYLIGGISVQQVKTRFGGTTLQRRDSVRVNQTVFEIRISLIN